MTVPELKLPYTLRIGVAGHRELRDQAAVVRAVQKLVSEIERELDRQDRTPLEWCVVSPGAKGADRVAAKAILEIKPSAELELVFPFSLEKYREDFADEEDLQEFESLRAVAARTIELHREGDFPGNQAERNQGYLEIGEVLADSVEILLLVWNGKPAKGKGGSGDLARYAAAARCNVIWIDSENPGQVRFFRRSKSKKEEIRSCPWEKRSALVPGYFKLDAFLHTEKVSQRGYLAEWGREVAELTSDAAQAGVPLRWLSWIQETFLPFQVRAGIIANRYQRLYKGACVLIFGLAALAGTTAVANQLFFHKPILTALEIGMMALVLMIWRVSHGYGWHAKWLGMRYLAEQIRIAKFAPDPAGHMDRAGQSLRFYSGPENWLRAAVGSIVALANREIVLPLTSNDRVPRPNPEGIKSFVISAWLARQRDWHEGNAHKKQHRAHRLHLWVVGFFVLTLLAASLHLFHIGGDFTVFLSIALPMWGASVHGMGRQLEFERLAQRSQQMAEALDQITERARRAHTEQEFADVLREAAYLSTTENYEWWVLLGFDPPELIV